MENIVRLRSNVSSDTTKGSPERRSPAASISYRGMDGEAEAHSGIV